MGANNYYGTNTFRLKPFSLDRLGILSLGVEVRVPCPLDQLGTVFSQFARIGAAPNTGINIPCVAVNSQGHESGNLIFDYLYEGFVGDFAGAGIVYELEGSDRQEAIETHPNILALMKKYAGTVPDASTGQVVWDLVAPKGVENVTGADGKARNPMSGVADYWAISYVWRKVWLSLDLPYSVHTNAGCRPRCG